MAEVTKVKFEFDAIERGWIKQSLGNQVKMLLRSRQKEIVGGEIWSLRGKEIEFLNGLISKF